MCVVVRCAAHLVGWQGPTSPWTEAQAAFAPSKSAGLIGHVVADPQTLPERISSDVPLSCKHGSSRCLCLSTAVRRPHGPKDHSSWSTDLSFCLRQGYSPEGPRPEGAWFMSSPPGRPENKRSKPQTFWTTQHPRGSVVYTSVYTSTVSLDVLKRVCCSGGYWSANLSILFWGADPTTPLYTGRGIGVPPIVLVL